MQNDKTKTALVIVLTSIITAGVFLIFNGHHHEHIDKAQANETLDNLHKYAASAEFDKYFNLYAKDAIFLGTDKSERWNIDEFKKYASKSNGWEYKLIERNLVINDHSIIFDEILDSTNYGISRGTGVIVMEDDQAKILQYHLTFPIPNDIASNITNQIKEFRANKL